MRGINRMMIVGHVGTDPELKHSAAGNAWCALSVATKRRRRDGDDWVEQTDWHDVRVFGEDAERCSHLVGKGSMVAIEGALTYDKWTDDQGQIRRKARVVANRVQFLSLRPVNAEGVAPAA